MEHPVTPPVSRSISQDNLAAVSEDQATDQVETNVLASRDSEVLTAPASRLSSSAPFIADARSSDTAENPSIAGLSTFGRSERSASDVPSSSTPEASSTRRSLEILSLLPQAFSCATTLLGTATTAVRLPLGLRASERNSSLFDRQVGSIPAVLRRAIDSPTDQNPPSATDILVDEFKRLSLESPKENRLIILLSIKRLQDEITEGNVEALLPLMSLNTIAAFFESINTQDLDSDQINLYRVLSLGILHQLFEHIKDQPELLNKHFSRLVLHTNVAL